MECAANLATSQQKAVVMTIHQPRPSIIQLFSRIVLLSEGGKLVFMGTVQGICLQYFALGTADD